MYQVSINDDFDLDKIADSGQCFRVKRLEDGMFRFITGEHILYIKRISGSADEVGAVYDISCDENEWQLVWVPYFDMGRSYSDIRAHILKNDIFMTKAATFGRGIRILRQDAWEMLISFIISQRKSIPSIKNSVEMLSAAYGDKIDTPYETIFTFPNVGELQSATEQALKECKLGYRVPYIIDAVAKASSHEIDLAAISSLSDDALIDALKTVKGVGDKVANCISLFAYGRIASAPVDTWIRQVIDSEYGGVNPFPGYGDVAGIMQQYAFFYAQGHRGDKDSVTA